MLDVKQKQFLIIFALLALIASNVCLFVLWSEAKDNIRIVKENAISELIKCECTGYEQIGITKKDFNIGGFVKSLK